MKVLIILQARMNSSRLPGKILAPIEGMPAIIYQIRRILPILNKDIGLVVATTNTPKDDELCTLLDEHSIEFFRGDENDVLDRFVSCSLIHDSEFIIRLNADCPLICPRLVKDVMQKMEGTEFDYASTILDETYPLGMHVEMMRSDLLESINKLSLSSEFREHVTPYIYKNGESYKLLSIVNKRNDSNFRVTVDYPEDLEVVREIAGYFKEKEFYLEDITDYLHKHPRTVERNLSFLKSQKLN